MKRNRSGVVLSADFDALDKRLEALEEMLSAGIPVEDTLPGSLAVAADLLRVYAAHAGKHVEETDDLLRIFKTFVNGDPSLNAVRDSIRELVFYRNCLEAERRDALPPAAGRMAVRVARHVYLYLRSRCEQEGRLG